MKIFTFYLFASLTTSLLLAGGQDIFDAGPSQWKRTPEWTIPYLTRPPVIDGTVDASEWLAASKFAPLVVGKDGLSSDFHQVVRMGYDDKNIYIAFRLERPKETPIPSVPHEQGRIDAVTIGNTDAAELMFAPNLDFDNSYSLLLFANEAFGDALCNRNKDTRWNPDWQRATRITATGWEGELAIPFAAFGLSSPPGPTEWWGFDFVDNRATPFSLTSHWSYRGNLWHNYENFGRIRFAKAPAIQVINMGALPNGQHGMAFAVANPTQQSFDIQAELILAGRDMRNTSGAKSYYDNIESGVTNDSQVEFYKGTNLTQMIVFAEEQYQSVEDITGAGESVSVPAGERKTFGLGGDLPLGEYTASYRITTGQDHVLAAGVSVFRITPPLSLQLEPYWLYSQLIDVFADVSDLEWTDQAKLVVSLLPAEADTPVISQTSQQVQAGADTVKVPLSVKDLQPGFYRVQAELFDASGESLAVNAVPVERPETPEWFNNEIGNQVEVPAPWTPVVADKKGNFEVWGRDYDLSQVFPSAVTSDGIPVLSAPIGLKTITGASELAWKVSELKVTKQSPGGVTYDVALEAPGLNLSGTMRAEFDGLIWYDLNLKPVAQPVDIQSMSLVIPVNPKLCELMGRHKFLTDPVLQTKAPQPDLNGLPGLLEHAKLPFTPYLWIGNEKAGMGFVAEAPIDWSIDKPNSVLETRPPENGRGGEILAHIIQKPMTLSKPMRLQFGLQATPIRETPEDRSILNIFQRNSVVTDEEVFEKVAELGGKVFVFYYDWRGNSQTEMGGTPERPVDPEQRKKLKKGIELAHKHGLKVILFTGWGVNATSPNWQKFSYELGKYPIENKGWGTYAQSAGENGAYIDFMAWGHADIAREYGADGVLWDSGANLTPDQNLRIGNAWVDDEGRARPKYGVLATRELYRRVYTIYKEEVGKDGIVYNHTGSMWPINVFADIQNRGEGRPMRASSLHESWTPFEEFRAEYSAEPFGTLYSGEVNDWAKLPMRVSTHSAVTLLHGDYAKEYSLLSPAHYRSYSYDKRPLIGYWQLFNWLPMDGSETIHYYYENKAGHYQAVKASPDSLLSSAFVSGDKKRAIVVVSNLDKKPIDDAVVDLDLTALGMPGDQPVTVEDGLLLTPLNYAQGKVVVDIEPERYRLLKITVGEQPKQSTES